MPSTTKKMNFLIEECVCRDLERLVPAGKRSKVVNEALRKELELLRRKSAVERLLAASPRQGGDSHSDVFELLAEDRLSHG
ncbi:MAG: hypothetical protein Q8P24_13290 [Desulfobacterales bacterium]|nr:hypothetical protein [Desulfobacterales bacterium]